MIRNLRNLPAHARLVALLLLIAVSLVLLIAVGRLGAWYWHAHQDLADSEPRVARLLGYRESEAALRQASASAAAELEGLVFAEDAASVGATVQQQVRRILENAGLSVLGSQVVDSVTHEALEEIRVNVTASGAVEALDLALTELTSARPLLLLDSLEINPVSMRRGDPQQLVNVAMAFKAVRVL